MLKYFVYIQMHQSEGKINPALSLISLYFLIIHPLQILIERFQNISNKALCKSMILKYFKYNK